MDFDIVECGYDKNNETINFGPRSQADGDSLHETVTLATVKTSVELSDDYLPQIDAFVNNGKLFLLINNSLKIFTDKCCSGILYNESFESNIDTFALSQNGFFLLICQKNGVIKIFDVRLDDVTCLFTGNVFEESDEPVEGKNYVAAFHEKSETENRVENFLIVTGNSQIYRVLIDFKSENEEKRVAVAELLYLSVPVQFASFSYPVLALSGSRSQLLFLVNVENLDVTFLENFSVIKLVNLGYMICGLDGNNRLFKMCLFTMVKYKMQNDMRYKDFIVISDKNKIVNHVIAITEPDEDNASCMQYLSYPDLSIVYSIKVSENVTFVSPENVNDELVYTSVVRKNGTFSELRLIMIYETEPNKRLERLLKKKKFEEAETFANKFSLGTDSINKAKAELIIDQQLCSSEDVELLTSQLDHIADVEFKLDACISVHSCCGKHSDAQKILLYGCRVASDHKQTSVNYFATKLKTEIMKLMIRFNTFTALYGSGDENMNSWYQFSGCCLLEELKTRLKNLKINEAITIYGRLDEDALKKLDDKKVEELLLILNQMPQTVLRPFLPTFIPLTLSYVPHVMSRFVKWLLGKVYQLEKHESDDFPENCIDFAENTIKLLKSDKIKSVSLQRDCNLNRKELSELQELLSTLRGIRVLKNFGVNVSISKYSRGPREIIRILLNVNLSFEEYDDLFKRYLCPLLLENSLEPEVIFFEEITNLMRSKESVCIPATLALLSNIFCVDLKLGALKIILETVPVPWCEELRNVAKEALRLSHPLVASIKNIIEDEPMIIVLKNPAYKFKHKKIRDIDDLQFSIRRILYLNGEDKIADTYKLCKTNEHKHEANLLLISHFIENDGFHKAISLLDDNDSDEIVKCCEYFLLYTERLINEDQLPLIRGKYYKILTSLHERLLNHSRNKNIDQKQKRLRLLQRTYTLNVDFHKKVKTIDLRSDYFKQLLLDNLINDLLIDCKDDTSIADIISTCDKIAFCLDKSKEDIIMRFCSLSQNLTIVLELAEYLCETCSTTESLCSLSLLLLDEVDDSKSKSQDNTVMSELSDSFEIDVSSSKLEQFLRCLTLANKVACKALLKADEEDLSPCMEVVSCVNSSFYLIRNQYSGLRETIARRVQQCETEISTPGFDTFSAVCLITRLYYDCIKSSNNSNMKFIMQHTANNINNYPLNQRQGIKLLPITIDDLAREHQQLTAHKLLLMLQKGMLISSNLNQDAILELNSILKRSYYNLLQKITSLNTTDLDADLLYTLLLNLDPKEAEKTIFQYLKQYKRIPKKFALIASTGVKLMGYHDMPYAMKACLKYWLDIKWWKKLKLYDSKIIFYDTFCKEINDKRLELLIKTGYADVEVINDYCCDFNLKAQTYYLIYLKQLLCNWNPDYRIESDMNGKKYLKLESNGDDLSKACFKVIDFIENKESVLKICESIWNLINFYHHEVFICILNIFSFIKPPKEEDMKHMMLSFLKSYRRVGKPSREEREYWHTVFPTTQNLDVFSEFRLPYLSSLYTEDVWKIIRPEITLDTYKFWFETISIFKHLNVDDICSLAVKQIATSGFLQSDSEWCFHQKFKSLLEKIDECIQHMTDKEKATSVAYHVVTHMPKGADQVEQARICYKYALMYRKSNPLDPGVEKAFIKVENVYYSLSAMHVLHVNKIADEKYMQLVGQPLELICTLYEDNRIIARSEDLFCPDINRAVSQLAKIFESKPVDVQKIKENLLNDWLSNSTVSSLDMTITCASNQSFSRTLENSRLSEDNLKRAIYLCSGDDVEYWQSYLMKIGYEENTEVENVYFKARALKCIAAISDIETIEKCTGVTYEVFLKYVDKLNLLSDMEHIGLKFDVETLDNCNKNELLRRLNHKGNTTMKIKIMASVCKIYSIVDVKYWKSIMNGAMKLNMIDELSQYVFVTKNADFIYEQFYIDAWQKVMSNVL